MQQDQIVALYRGWANYEKSIREDGVYVIDFDLVQDSYADKVATRWEVIEKLIEYRNALSNKDPVSAFLKDKLNGSIHYLQAVMGENTPFEKYIFNTMGIIPHLFSASKIEDISYEISDLLSEWDISYKHNCLEEFYLKFRIENFIDFENRTKTQIDFWYSKMKKLIDLPSMPKVHFQFVNKNENWDTWIYGYSSEGICLDINMNPSMKFSFINSTPTLLATHELCGHALHMATIATEIQKGNIPPSCGLILVHGSDMIQTEGLAHLLPEFFEGQIPIDNLTKVSRKFITHRNLVLNNAYIYLSNGESIKDVYTYVVNNLPFYDGRYLELELKQWNRDPSMKSYRFIQGFSEDFFRNICENLSSEQRIAFVQQMYKLPMTYEQIKTYYHSLI